MSVGLYSHVTRATGTVLTAAIYNGDHVNHITNQTPQMTGAYSDNVAQMQSATDPGLVGTESLAGSLAGELERLRFAIKRLGGGAQWYVAPVTGTFTTSVVTPVVDSGGAVALSLRTNNGTEQVRVLHLPNAVNFITLTGQTSGNRTKIGTDGTDTNIPLEIASKGTGTIFIYPGGSGAGRGFQILFGSSGASLQVVLGGTNVQLQGDTSTPIEFPFGVVLGAGGIAFPATQSASTNVNTLDDYEEAPPGAPWGAGLSFGGAAVGWIFTGTNTYEKIGKFVRASFDFSVTKGSSTGVCLLTGLPFTVANGGSAGSGGGLADWQSMLTNFVYISTSGVNNTTTAKLMGLGAAGASLTQLTDAAFQNGSVVRGTICYQATA